MLNTPQPHGIFLTIFAVFDILTLSRHWNANGDKALPSIIPVSRAQVSGNAHNC